MKKLSAVVVGFGFADSPSAPHGQTATAGVTGDAVDAPPAVDEEYDGTAVHGAKPYLTVIDGMTTLPVPVPIPVFLAQLTAPSVSLAPLPAQADGRTGPANAAGTRAEPAPPPGSRLPDNPPPPLGSVSGQGGERVTLEPHSDSGGRADRDDDSDKSDESDEGRPDDDHTGGGPSVPPPDSAGPPVAAPGPPGLEAPSVGTPPHAVDTGRPPHADETGRPPHADETGRPPHADETGRPPHAGRSPAAGAPAAGEAALDEAGPAGPLDDQLMQR